MTKHKILPIPLASSDANAMLEDYMSKLEQKVFDQTHQLKVITDNASSCLFLLDQNGCATYMNPAAQKVTGYTLEDVTGKPILTFLHIANPLHEGSLYRCLLTRVLQGPAIVKDQEDVFTRKDGSGYFVSYSVTPLVRRDTPDGFLLEFQDSTKRKDLERQREEFLGIVSHELKTPVTSMKSYTQVLQRQFEQRGDMETARSLAKIDAQINKLTSLIGDLLDVTRVETGHLRLSEEHFSIDDLVEEIVTSMQLTTERHKLRICGRTNVFLNADRDRTGQILINLLANAIKYSPHNDQIHVTVRVEETRVVIEVQDFGIGIPEEKQRLVFERFMRVSGPRMETFAGLGLGLFICAQIVHRQGGEIWVESVEGEGSTFSFSLPLQDD